MPEIESGDGWSFAPDKQGHRRLGLRGPWTEQTAKAVRDLPWDRISLQAVEWPDYTPLLPFKDRLLRLSVFDGPAKVDGLDELTRISELELLRARLSSAPRLERLEQLSSLEIYWKKGISPAVLALPGLRNALVASLPFDDLRVAGPRSAVARLELREGSLKSLAGLEAFSDLRHLCLVNIRALADISQIATCAGLEYLELDGCPKLEELTPATVLPTLRTLKLGSLKRARPLPSSDWLARMPALEEALVDVDMLGFDPQHLVGLRQLRLAALRLAPGVLASPQPVLEALRQGGRPQAEVELNHFKTHSLLVVSTPRR